MVNIALDNNIGTHSVLPTKVIASTYEVYRPIVEATALDGLMVHSVIHKNTIIRFTGRSRKYYSYSEPVYKKYNLEASRTEK